MAKDVKKITRPKETRISDLQLASYLLALDYPIIRTEGTSQRTQFIFSDVPDEIFFRFYQGDSSVNPRKLLDAYRNLKGLLIQQERGQR